jgi:hypothetical protein
MSKKMTMDELLAVVNSELSDAFGSQYGHGSDKLNVQRARSLRYYLGRPMGNEIDGRSKVVLTDVRDAVEWVMPTLMRIFMGGDKVVVFEPVSSEDEALAEQQTDYCNYVIRKQNRGFELFYTWLKDALIQKNGVLKVWWTKEEKIRSEHYYGLDSIQLNDLLSQPGVEIKERTSRGVADEAGTEIEVHDVRIERSYDDSRVVIENVPPEEFLISRHAKTLDLNEVPFVAHYLRKTRSQLKKEGYKKIDDISGDTSDAFNYSQEALERREFDDQSYFRRDEINDKSQEELWVAECYMLVDYDGDGIAERRKITRIGGSDYSGGKIMDNDLWEGSVPFVSITPVLMPHRFYGLSLADLVMEIQEINSTLLRQLLDNIYNVNNSRHVVIQGQVNLDDILRSRPGGIIRAASPGAVTPLPSQPIPASAFTILEYMASVRENRTGITRYNQGLSADTLNKTATGISRIMDASQQRIELIARLFAETGVRELFKVVRELLIRYQDKPKVVKLRNQWVEMNPSQWNPDMDSTINVGIGTGNKDQEVANITTIMQVQEKLLQAGYANLVTPDNIYRTAEKLVEATGLKNADEFFTDPANTQGAEQLGSETQATDPQVEMQQAKAQLEMQKMQQDMQFQAEKHQMEMSRAGMEDEYQAMQGQAKADGETSMVEAVSDRIEDLEKYVVPLLQKILQRLDQPTTIEYGPNGEVAAVNGKKIVRQAYAERNQ